VTEVRVLRGVRSPEVLDLRVELQLDSRRPPEAQVRAWIDSEPNGGLGTEAEVPMERRRGFAWHGTVPLPSPAGTFVLYRLAIWAATGAVWSFQVRDRNTGLTLHDDSDTLHTPKLWLVGTCPLKQAAPVVDLAMRAELGRLIVLSERRCGR
jgi:hypothetical protein